MSTPVHFGHPVYCPHSAFYLSTEIYCSASDIHSLVGSSAVGEVKLGADKLEKEVGGLTLDRSNARQAPSQPSLAPSPA
eukprot:3881209-Pyramimonas_sp.AAC.2